MPESTDVALQGLADGANLALQAKKAVHLYRCVQVKISTVTGYACRIPVETIRFVEATTAEMAKNAYLQEVPLLKGDDAGDWTVSCVKQSMSHCAN